MDVAIIGLGHAFLKQYNALKTNERISDVELCDINPKKIKKYNCNNNYLTLKANDVIIATSPILHLEMTKQMALLNKRIILEKPIVVSLDELKELKKFITKDNYYNSLHFAYGLEIEYFINNINLRPKKIYCYISDNYVSNNKIKKKAISLCGSYLDETINPLSALARIYGYDINYISNKKKKYLNDKYDYYSISKFTISNIPLTIEVMWNNKKSQKYIDLEYDDYVIRLDSMNQKVINMTTKEILFSGSDDRMTNHYIGVYNDYIKNGSNLESSIKLYEEILKGV